jgi:adenylosuccinate synthase
MPVSIVIGGQFGSEGKGKVALEIVRRSSEPVTVARVGGPNSGHTAYDRMGRKYVLRQLPAGCIDRDVDVVLPAGSYIDADVLLSEIEQLDYPKDRIRISGHARIITEHHKQWEKEAKLEGAIGSTGSGVGAAVMASVARGAANLELKSFEAADYQPLQPYLCDMSHHLRRLIDRGDRIILEGTQGFGLSLMEGGYWPKATSRSTTAAGALAEAGLSPLDADDVTMVVRSYPIRVAGNSGPLANETTWEQIARKAERDDDLREYTTVTGRLRRVGNFDPALVKRALAVNRPTRLVLNHLDYVGGQRDVDDAESAVSRFIRRVEMDIGQKVDWFGFSRLGVVDKERQEA